MQLVQAFAANVARRPHAPAVRTLNGLQSYAELDRRSDEVSSALREAGVGPGDRVSVQTPNRPEFVEVLLGLAKVGAVLVPVSYLDGPTQLEHILVNSQAAVHFFDSSVAATAVAAVTPDVLPVCFDSVEGLAGPSYAEFLSKGDSFGMPASYDEGHTLYIGYTSGSTGHPKGVVKSHRSVVQLAFASAIEWGLRPEQTQLVTMPLCHSGGLWQLVYNLVLGGCAAFTPAGAFDPTMVLDLLDRWNIDWSIFVPTMSDLLIEQGGAGHNGFPNLKVLGSGAAPMFSSTKEGLLDLFPNVELNECYGATETGVVTNLGHLDQLRKQRCVGRPILGVTAMVVGPDGEQTAPGEIGELVCRSPYLLDEYYQLPERTAQGRRGDGFFGVGDLAVQDEEGYFYIVDRKDDMIISGGFNIYPAEVEEILKSQPGIRDAIVVGLPDAKWGERVTAALVTDADIDTETLAAICRERLPSYKVPKDFRIQVELPKLVSGKNARRLVRDALLAPDASAPETN